MNSKGISKTFEQGVIFMEGKKKEETRICRSLAGVSVCALRVHECSGYLIVCCCFFLCVCVFLFRMLSRELRVLCVVADVVADADVVTSAAV